jgi:hypothetical protein
LKDERPRWPGATAGETESTRAAAVIGRYAECHTGTLVDRGKMKKNVQESGLNEASKVLKVEYSRTDGKRLKNL